MVLVAVVEFFSRSLLSAHSSRQLLVPMFHYHRPNQHFSTIIYPLSLLISKLHFCSCRTSYNLKLMWLLPELEMKTNYYYYFVDSVMMMKFPHTPIIPFQQPEAECESVRVGGHQCNQSPLPL